jgi:hypothetical protein
MSRLSRRNARSGDRPPESEHPLPWRNRPSDGLNHVTDAAGQPVYDGTDAAEMFRRYSVEVQAERARAGDRPADQGAASGTT